MINNMSSRVPRRLKTRYNASSSKTDETHLVKKCTSREISSSSNINSSRDYSDMSSVNGANSIEQRFKRNKHRSRSGGLNNGDSRRKRALKNEFSSKGSSHNKEEDPIPESTSNKIERFFEKVVAKSIELGGDVSNDLQLIKDEERREERRKKIRKRREYNQKKIAIANRELEELPETNVRPPARRNEVITWGLEVQTPQVQRKKNVDKIVKVKEIVAELSFNDEFELQAEIAKMVNGYETLASGGQRRDDHLRSKALAIAYFQYFNQLRCKHFALYNDEETDNIYKDECVSPLHKAERRLHQLNRGGESTTIRRYTGNKEPSFCLKRESPSTLSITPPSPVKSNVRDFEEMKTELLQHLNLTDLKALKILKKTSRLEDVNWTASSLLRFIEDTI